VKRWPRADVVEGWVDSHLGIHTAILRMKNGDQVWIERETVREANELLSAAGVAPAQQVFSARLLSAAARFPGGVLLASLALFVVPAALAAAAGMIVSGGQAFFGAVLAISALVTGYKLLQALVPPRAVVGTDGVRVEGLGMTRFISYAGVDRVELDPRGVWLRGAGGDELLATSKASTALGRELRPSANTVALYHRVREARAVGDGSAVAQTKLELLDRKGRPLTEWLRDVAVLPQEQGGYRRMSIGRDELVRVLLDPAATAERRIAAAVALCATGEPDVRERVRIAGESCANEPLRIAIDAAADGELEEDIFERAVGDEPRPRTIERDTPDT